ncbi:MAG: hypothetical protein JJE47_14260 [Acidimicrobiia bacterium]|nr:hypothetical protein [Acidimicrobiia bacterium]
MRSAATVVVLGAFLIGSCAAGGEPAGTVGSVSPSTTVIARTTASPSTTFQSATSTTNMGVNAELAALVDRIPGAIASNDVDQIDALLNEFYALADSGNLTGDPVAVWDGVDELFAARNDAVFASARLDLKGPELTAEVATTLPQEFFVVQVGTGVVIVGPDGEALGSLANTDVGDERLRELLPGDPVDHQYFQVGNRVKGFAKSVGVTTITDTQILIAGNTPIDILDRYVATSVDDLVLTVHDWDHGSQPSIAIDTATGKTVELSPGCRVSVAVDEGWYLICTSDAHSPDGAFAEVRFRHRGGETTFLGGPAFVNESGNGPTVVGHWASVQPGPDGTLLGQWSGECEVPSAHVLVDQDWWHVWYDGHDLVVAADMDSETWGWAESWALGWLESGQAAIGARGGGCSWDESGLLLVRPDGSFDVIYPFGDAELWRRVGE